MNIRNFNFWVIAKPAEDVPGEWVAHCLEVDVVSQGSSLNHAFEMVAEAVAMVVTEDIATGKQPTDRRAPEEFWGELWDVVHSGKPLPKGGVPDEDVTCAAAQMVISVVEIHAPQNTPVRRTSSVPPPQAPKWNLPVIWGDSPGLVACA